jgi:hypothetical protein
MATLHFADAKIREHCEHTYVQVLEFGVPYKEERERKIRYGILNFNFISLCVCYRLLLLLRWTNRIPKITFCFPKNRAFGF